MTDRKQHEAQRDALKEKPELEAETLQDLNPSEEESEAVKGGVLTTGTGGQRNQCYNGTW